MTRSARFKQADVKRASAGAVAAGLTVARIEIDVSGKIVIVAGQPIIESENDNEWADLE
jgi:hypothetical protein